MLSAGDLTDVQDGNHGELHPKREDFVPEGIPFLMTKDLAGGAIDFDGCYRITQRQYRGLRIGFATAGDVLLSHKGSIGETAIVPGTHRDVMLTPQMTYRVAASSRLTDVFLLTWMRSAAFQRRMRSLAAQSTRDYVGITAQKRELLAVLPRPSEQEQIATVAEVVEEDIRVAASQATKLQLLKRGLMHDLLTGRVRVSVGDTAEISAHA